MEFLITIITKWRIRERQSELKKNKGSILTYAKAKEEKHIVKERRFNGPLVAYLERMYPQVLYNYKQFYKHLDALNPKRPDLKKKSKEFRTWVKENPIPMTTPPLNEDETAEDCAEIERIFNEMMGKLSPDDLFLQPMEPLPQTLI